MTLILSFVFGAVIFVVIEGARWMLRPEARRLRRIKKIGRPDER